MINRISDPTPETGKSHAADAGRRRSGRTSDFSHLLRAAFVEPAGDAQAARGRDIAKPDAWVSRPLGGLAEETGAQSPVRVGIGVQPNRASEPSKTAGDLASPGTQASSETQPDRSTAIAPSGSLLPQPAAVSTNGAGFVRSSDSRSSSLLRFSAVPPQAKHPAGPYRQAPAEFGGDWWMVNPFTGPEPWMALAPQDAEGAGGEPLPEGFERAVGARPDSSNFDSRWAFQEASMRWERDLVSFQQTGLPEGFGEEQLETIRAQFEEWGLGEPVFYESGHGWKVRFPDSALPTFESAASTAFLAPHLVIALHQARSLQTGLAPGKIHPWLPEQIRPA